MAVGIKDRRCATCRWWNGERMVGFVNNRPFYVEVGNSNSTCSAKRNGQANASSYCHMWALWEKL